VNISTNITVREKENEDCVFGYYNKVDGIGGIWSSLEHQYFHSPPKESILQCSHDTWTAI